MLRRGVFFSAKGACSKLPPCFSSEQEEGRTHPFCAEVHGSPFRCTTTGSERAAEQHDPDNCKEVRPTCQGSKDTASWLECLSLPQQQQNNNPHTQAQLAAAALAARAMSSLQRGAPACPHSHSAHHRSSTSRHLPSEEVGSSKKLARWRSEVANMLRHDWLHVSHRPVECGMLSSLHVIGCVCCVRCHVFECWQVCICLRLLMYWFDRVQLS